MSLPAFLGCLVTIVTVMPIAGVGGATRVCCIRGDPHLKQFSGNKGSLPIPCMYRMTHTARFEVDTGLWMEVVVFTASSLNTIVGRYYIDCAKVEVYFFDSLDPDAVPVAEIVYQAYAVNMVAFTVLTTGDDAWTRTGHSDVPYSAYIMKMYSHASRKALLIFKDVNDTHHVKVEMFPRLGLPGALKKRGIKVTVTMDAQPQVHNALFPLTVCSTFNDTVWGTGETDLATNEQIALHGVLSQEIIPSKPQCDSAHNAFSLFCNTAAKKKAAIAACIEFAQKTNVRCLDSLIPGGVSGDSHQVFGHCMKDSCGFPTGGLLAAAIANLANPAC